jgi:hypothetical protein
MGSVNWHQISTIGRLGFFRWRVFYLLRRRAMTDTELAETRDRLIISHQCDERACDILRLVLEVERLKAELACERQRRRPVEYWRMPREERP